MPGRLSLTFLSPILVAALLVFATIALDPPLGPFQPDGDSKFIILFDGDCNLCDWSVNFLLRRDARGVFQFSSQQSGPGSAFLAQYDCPKDLSTVTLIANGKAYFKSNAALLALAALDQPWNFLSIFRIVPLPIRDFVYVLIASNRYALMGTHDSCVPMADVNYTGRFLE